MNQYPINPSHCIINNHLSSSHTDCNEINSSTDIPSYPEIGNNSPLITTQSNNNHNTISTCRLLLNSPSQTNQPLFTKSISDDSSTSNTYNCNNSNSSTVDHLTLCQSNNGLHHQSVDVSNHNKSFHSISNKLPSTKYVPISSINEIGKSPHCDLCFTVLTDATYLSHIQTPHNYPCNNEGICNIYLVISLYLM